MAEKETQEVQPAQPEKEKRNVVYLNYFDMIDMIRVQAIMLASAQLVKQQNADELYFLFASPGGEVAAGIVLYNFLKALPVPITMHNMGQVGSIANVVFMAGDNRFAAPHSSFHFHGVGLDVKQGQRFVLSSLRELTSQFEDDHNKIAGILQVNTELSETEILQFFDEGVAKNAQFAKEKGIVTDIVSPKIPKEAMFATINVGINSAQQKKS